MPRRVDQEARRRQIAEALWRLTADRGLEAVSLRHVAAEAGVSMGLVQHYFRTKNEMCRFALTSIQEPFQRRLAARLGDGPDAAAPAPLLRALAEEMLPLDEERRMEARVGFAFLARALVEPELAAFFQGIGDRLRGFVTATIRQAADAGQARAGIDPERETATLLALVDGLAGHLLAGHLSPAAALDAVQAHLDRLLPGAGRQA